MIEYYIDALIEGKYQEKYTNTVLKLPVLISFDGADARAEMLDAPLYQWWYYQSCSNALLALLWEFNEHFNKNRAAEEV